VPASKILASYSCAV